MSWRVEPIGRAFAAAAALSVAALLSGCGFTPLYATPAVGAGLSAIQVNVPHGRAAFLLGEDLDDDLARDRDKAAVYRLDVTLIQKLFPRGLRVDNTADHYESHLIASYSLVEIENGKVLKTGSEPVEVSYAASGEPYAGIAAQQDAQSRAASVAAQRITIDLGAYFSSLAEK
jgi:LPS-assembly lipoprotein